MTLPCHTDLDGENQSGRGFGDGRDGSGVCDCSAVGLRQLCSDMPGCMNVSQADRIRMGSLTLDVSGRPGVKSPYKHLQTY